MRVPTSHRPARGFAMVLLLAGLAAGQYDTQALHLQPSRVDADKAFSLQVLGYRWVCGSTFTHSALARTATGLAVRFLPNPPSEPICQALIPLGPRFEVPALPAGRYPVHATVLLPCQVAASPCEVREMVERVGILTVGKPESADWFINPGTVMPGRKFTLQMLSHRYGDCQTSFDRLSLSVEGGRLVAGFGTRTDTGRVCIQDSRPHGPGFLVEGLPAGRYPVDVLEPPSQAARTVDTLYVANFLVPTAVQAGPLPREGRPDRLRAGGGLYLGPFLSPPGSGGIDLQGRVHREPGLSLPRTYP